MLMGVETSNSKAPDLRSSENRSDATTGMRNNMKKCTTLAVMIQKTKGRISLASTGLPARHGMAAEANWDLVTEYPATSMPGEGVAHFTAAATRLSAGALAVRPGFDAPGGLRSADMLRAVVEGRREPQRLRVPHCAPVLVMPILICGPGVEQQVPDEHGQRGVNPGRQTDAPPGAWRGRSGS